MVVKEQGIVKEGLRGGEGKVTLYHILSAEELMGHGTMFAKVVIHPHSSIGWHQHVGNTEPYYITKGEGVFTDNDGTKTVIRPGDICKIECGQWHAIANESDEDMEMIALVINEGPKA